MNAMPPRHLQALIKQKGTLEKQSADQVFHAQDFTETMFLVKSGYVKRYQITKDNKRVIELIYGPGHLFPLTQLYRKMFTVRQNQEHLVYVYEAMTDIEIWRIADTEIEAGIKEDWKIYIDLYYEFGIRIKENINRLASNAIRDDYKKVTHQLVCLADDFGTFTNENGIESAIINLPLTPIDMAEQLNISTDVAAAVMSNLVDRKLITIADKLITVPDIELLKDTYL